MLERYDREKP